MSSKPRYSWIADESGQILALNDERILPYLPATEKASLWHRSIRFRTLGYYPQTGAVESRAETASEVIAEMPAGGTSERQGRLLGNDPAGSMEKKKRERYF